MPQYPASIDLQTLTGSTGYTFRSATAGDWLGYAVRIVGDVNGDSIADYIIGAPGEDPLPTAVPSHTLTGRSFLVFGGTANLATLDAADGTVDNVINPVNLNGTTGYVVQGVMAGDQTGASVSGGSDLNGDSLPDILIGSPSFSGSAAPGSVALIGGGASNLAALDAADGTGDGVIHLSNAASGGYTIAGPDAGDHAGFSVSSLNDINGDGFADFLVGANFADAPGLSSGEAYVVFGGPTGLEALDAADTVNDNNIDLSNLSSTTGYVFFGGATGDQAGIAVAGIQDVNNDGISDLLIGAWLADPHGASSGSTYIVFGGASNLAALDTAGGGAADGRINLSAVNGSNGFVLDGAVAGDHVGLGLACTDIDGDGIGDLILGAYLADPQAPAGNQGGEAYIIFGGANLASTDAADGSANGHLSPAQLNGTHGYRIISEGPVDWLGYSIAAAGDVNGDGFNDIIVGSNYGDSGGNLSGETFVVFGGTANLAAWDAADGNVDGKLDVDFLNGSNGFRLQGVDAGDQSGTAVTSLGDVNSDGLADLAVGAPRANSLAGESYVVFSRLPDAAVNRTGTDQGQNLVGGNFDDFLSGLGGNDVLYGHGGADFLDGGSGNDVLLGGEDGDFLVGGAGDDLFNGGNGTDMADFMFASVAVTADLTNTAAQDTGEGLDTFVSIENMMGSAFNDTLTGNSGANTLDGYTGDDTLFGLDGNDTLIGGEDDDTLDGGLDNDTADYSFAASGVTVSLLTSGPQDTLAAGIDTLVSIENLAGSFHDDTLTGNNGDNTLSGSDGNDKLLGRNGVDTLDGGHGNDTLVGGGGADIMTGGDGDDTYMVDNALDQTIEVSGGGNDRVLASANYTLATGVDIETLKAATGDGLVLRRRWRRHAQRRRWHGQADRRRRGRQLLHFRHGQPDRRESR